MMHRVNSLVIKKCATIFYLACTDKSKHLFSLHGMAYEVSKLKTKTLNETLAMFFFYYPGSTGIMPFGGYIKIAHAHRKTVGRL